MNLQDFLGEPLSHWLRDRTNAQVDMLVGLLILALLGLAYRRMGRSAFFVRYSLLARVIVGLVIIAFVATVGLLVGGNAAVVLAATFLAFGLLVFWILRDVTNVGITNAFETTKQGVSAEASLKEVKAKVEFLGIGASKLTDTPEFDEMLKRCAMAGGTLKFLLSHPDNEELEKLAKQNRRHDKSYRSRVRESIREIHTRATAAGAQFEIRLYNLKQKIALPHFRLMFIDDRLCIFSQVFWSENEGLDNPQLILRPNQSRAASSLYSGYHSYFDDLWDLDTTEKVDIAMLDGWPA